jgi:hypothetical protein
MIALVAGFGNGLILTGIFVVLWLSSAKLFRKAAQGEGPGGRSRSSLPG